MTHTPGPWTAHLSKDGSGDVGIAACGVPNVIAECFAAMRHRGERASGEALANARLIAAAPDMLVVLQDAHEVLHRLTAIIPGNDRALVETTTTMERIRVAIAKATEEDKP